MQVKMDYSKLETVIIDRLQLAVVEKLRTDYPMVAQNLTIERHPCPDERAVIWAFMSYLADVHRDDKDTVTLYKYPATPWDFIKDKYAPKWFLKRWPVRYESKEVVVHSLKHFMCPHLPTEPVYPHAIWLKMNQDTSWWQ